MVEHYDENLLLGYVEGELDDQDRATVEQWAEQDPRLKQLLRHMAEDRRAIRSVPAPAPPRWVMDEIDRQLERSMLLEEAPPEAPTGQAEPRYVIGRIGITAAVAAMLLIASGVIFVSLWGLEGQQIAFNPATSDESQRDEGADGDADGGTDVVAMDDKPKLGDEQEPDDGPGLAAADAPGEDGPRGRRATSGAMTGDAGAVAEPGTEAEPRLSNGMTGRTDDNQTGGGGGGAGAGLNRTRAETTDGDAIADGGGAAATAVSEAMAELEEEAQAFGGMSAEGADAPGRQKAAGAAEQLVIRVQTRDVNRTIERLNFATNQIARARLRGVAPAGTALAKDEASMAEESKRIDARATFTGDRAGAAAEANVEDAGVRGMAANVEPGEAAAPAGAADAIAGGPTDPTDPAEREQDEQPARAMDAAMAQRHADDAEAGDEALGEALADAEVAPTEEPVNTDGAPDADGRVKSGTRTVRLELEIPADQVETVVQLMNAVSADEQAEPDGPYQRALVTREPVQRRMLEQREGLIAETRRNWPSYQPDYGDIVREQLRLADGAEPDSQVAADAAEGAGAAERRDEKRRESTMLGLVVPVVIEHYGELPPDLTPPAPEAMDAEPAATEPAATDAEVDPEGKVKDRTEGDATADAEADANAEAEAEADAGDGADADTEDPSDAH